MAVLGRIPAPIRRRFAASPAFARIPELTRMETGLARHSREHSMRTKQDEDLQFGLMAVELEILTARQFFELAGFEGDQSENRLARWKAQFAASDPEQFQRIKAAAESQASAGPAAPGGESASASTPRGETSVASRTAADDASAGSALSLDHGSQPIRNPNAAGRLQPDESLAAVLCLDPDGEDRRFQLAALASQRYTVGPLIAEGGLGRVSQARDHELGRTVAFKQVKDRFATDPDSLRRFLFEAEVTGQLEHPGIVPVHSLGCDARRRPFYAMRMIGGESLQAAIRNWHGESGGGPAKGGPASSTPDSLGFRKLLRHMVAVCHAIDYAHSRQVIHRDLKPANIMIGEFGETFVVDWGLARRMDRTVDELAGASEAGEESAEHTSTGQVLGTPAWMAPEQAAGDQAAIGPRSDIYALGAMLYFLLTGQRPFSATDTESLLSQIRGGQFEPPRAIRSHVPAALNAICLKAMALRPGDRYGSAHELADDLERWLADEPVSAWREPLSTRTRRWIKRHRVLAGAVVATLLTALAGLGLILMLQRESNRRLQRANADERAARNLAERQFDLARSAVSQFHNEVTTDFLLGQAEFAGLRASLLAAPREFYRQLLSRQESVVEPTPDQLDDVLQSRISLGRLAEDLNDLPAALDEYDASTGLARRLVALRVGAEKIPAAECAARLSVSRGLLLSKLGRVEEAIKVYQQAAGEFRNLLEGQPDHFGWELLLARSETGRAVAEGSLGRSGEARAAFAEAIRLFEGLLKRKDDPEVRKYLGQCYTNLGTVLENAGDRPGAIAAYEMSLELVKSQVAGPSADSEQLFDIAAATSNLAESLRADGQDQRSMTLHRQAERDFQTLVRMAPNVARFQAALAATLNNEGLLFAGMKDYPAAQRAYEESLAIKTRMAEAAPEAVDLAISLGGGCINFGGFFVRIEDFENAMTWYTRGIDVLTDLLKRHPDAARARLFLANGYTNRGRAWWLQEKHAEARADTALAIGFADEQQQKFLLKCDEALLTGVLGDNDKASTTCIALLDEAVGTGQFGKLAMVQAACYGNAADRANTGEGDPDLAETIASRAYQTLERAFAAGDQNRPEFRRFLRTHAELAPLRKHPEFKSFLERFGDR